MPYVNNINLTEYNFALFILHTIEKKQHKMKEWSLPNKRKKLFSKKCISSKPLYHKVYLHFTLISIEKEIL